MFMNPQNKKQYQSKWLCFSERFF